MEETEQIVDIAELNNDQKTNNTNVSETKKLSLVAKTRKRIGIKCRKTGKAVRDILKNRQEAPTCSVSREDLNNTLRFFKNFKQSRDIFKEKCVAPIYLEGRVSKIETGFFVNLLELARKCLLEKDWDGLAKVLVCAKPLTRSDYSIYFTVFLTYAFICLCHNPDKKLLDIFLQSVLMCNSDQEKHDVFNHLVCLERN